MKNKAERLLQRLKDHPDVKWNSLGEFEYQGQSIKNSNLTDLVNDVLRKRKHAVAPLGWETFANVLQRINVPQDLVGNLTRWSYMRKSDWFNTPRISPRNVALTSVKKQREPVDDPFKQRETPRKWKKSQKKERIVDWVTL